MINNILDQCSIHVVLSHRLSMDLLDAEVPRNRDSGAQQLITKDA